MELWCIYVGPLWYNHDMKNEKNMKEVVASARYFAALKRDFSDKWVRRDTNWGFFRKYGRNPNRFEAFQFYLEN